MSIRGLHPTRVRSVVTRPSTPARHAGIMVTARDALVAFPVARPLLIQAPTNRWALRLHSRRKVLKPASAGSRGQCPGTRSCPLGGTTWDWLTPTRAFSGSSHGTPHSLRQQLHRGNTPPGVTSKDLWAGSSHLSLRFRFAGLARAAHSPPVRNRFLEPSLQLASYKTCILTEKRNPTRRALRLTSNRTPFPHSACLSFA